MSFDFYKITADTARLLVDTGNEERANQHLLRLMKDIREQAVNGNMDVVYTSLTEEEIKRVSALGFKVNPLSSGGIKVSWEVS